MIGAFRLSRLQGHVSIIERFKPAGRIRTSLIILQERIGILRRNRGKWLRKLGLDTALARAVAESVEEYCNCVNRRITQWNESHSTTSVFLTRPRRLSALRGGKDSACSSRIKNQFADPVSVAWRLAPSLIIAGDALVAQALVYVHCYVVRQYVCSYAAGSSECYSVAYPTDLQPRPCTQIYGQITECLLKARWRVFRMSLTVGQLKNEISGVHRLCSNMYREQSFG